MKAPVGIGNVAGITFEGPSALRFSGRVDVRFDLLFVPPLPEEGDFGAAVFAIYDPFLSGKPWRFTRKHAKKDKVDRPARTHSS